MTIVDHPRLLSSSAAKNAKSNMLVNVVIISLFCIVNTVFLFEARVGFEPTSFIVSGYEPDDLTTSLSRNVIINMYLF